MERFILLALIVLLNSPFLFAQSPSNIIQDFLIEHHQEQNLTLSDISDWHITSQHKSSTSGLLHVYIQQIHQGIKIANGVANFSLKNDQVFSMGNRLVTNIQQKVAHTTAKITAKEAIQFALQHLELPPATNLTLSETINQQHFIYNKAGISQEAIPVQLLYHETNDQAVKLVWDLSIYTLDAQHWWSVRIDAQNGDLIDQNDWVLHCNFEHAPFSKCKKNAQRFNPSTPFNNHKTAFQPDQYTVFAFPIESPIHGTRSIVTNPADNLASPYGWHDTNGMTGAEYTITRGNNVYAYEDSSANNLPGFSPDGGPSLEFNFPYNSLSSPHNYQEASITNLFYANNIMHDIWYRYGFDEASGNFQSNNYTNGGLDGDYLLAEALDGFSLNNASMTVQNDGTSPRMQLFLWNVNAGEFLSINSPSSIAGNYQAGSATFGAPLTSTAITGNIVLVEDNVPPIHNACEPLTNTAAINGKIALIEDDNNCLAIDKVLAAQNAGAIAAIIAHDYPTVPFFLDGVNSSITIPSIRISQAVGDSIKAKLALSTVNASLSTGAGPYYAQDSDLDNGIIAHEYGHGISIRLVGGAASANCLSNAEQMGEGWSDWFALMLTIESGDIGSDPRGIANYTMRQSTTDQGLRPAPYSTDFAVNPYTFGASNNTAEISEPHGLGFIFATALWDLTWALINQYGGTPDMNFYNGTGGNNIAMNLVIESLKLLPCEPGMLDGRNAILQADQLLYGGLHNCLIWNVFAARGFGYLAIQGDPQSRTDQIEDFTTPNICLIPTQTPVAAFSQNSTASCVKTISFIDNSNYVPQFWSWSFGDGATSNVQHPIHNYQAPGTYTVKLISSNSFGVDSITQQITISAVPTPLVNDVTHCLGDTVYLAASNPANLQWLDTSNMVIHTGNTLTLFNNNTVQTYYAQNTATASSQFIGPLNRNIGSGSYLSFPFYHRALNFTAQQGVTIVSALVYPNTPGPRTIYLSKGINSDGSPPSGPDILDIVTINISSGGPQRVALNLVIPDSGNYNIGGNNVGLFNNLSGVQYPYVLDGYLSIDSSSNNVNPTNTYYAFYDIEVKDLPCTSAIDTVLVEPINSNFSYVDNGGNITFTDASIGVSSWFWEFGDNNTSNQQNPVHTYATSGNYTVTLTINNGSCSSTRIVSVVVGVQRKHSALPNITLLPNPSTHTASIQLNRVLSEALTIQLIDLHGKLLQTTTLKAGLRSLNLDVSTLPAAVYFVHINGKEFSEIRKLVVK